MAKVRAPESRSLTRIRNTDGTSNDAFGVHLSWTRGCKDAGQRATEELLRSDSSWIREETVSQLLDQGKPSAPWVISALVGCLKDAESDVRRAAAESLARCGTKVRSFVSLRQLEELSQDASQYERAFVALAAWRIFGDTRLAEEQ
jgi:HEAT repeat protein